MRPKDADGQNAILIHGNQTRGYTRPNVIVVSFDGDEASWAALAHVICLIIITC